MTIRRILTVWLTAASLLMVPAAVQLEATPRAAAEPAPDRKEAGEEDSTSKREARREARESRREARKRRKRAKRLFRVGMKQVDAQKYGDAIQSFTQAYELDPQPEHLLNLGVAHHLHGDEQAEADDMQSALQHRQKAMDYYQRYLATKPRRHLAAQTRLYMEELQHRLEVTEQLLAAQDARRAAEKELERARQAAREAEEARADAIRQAREDREKVRQQVEAAEGERDKWRDIATSKGSGAGAGKRAMGTTIMVVGGLALGAAAFYGLDARSANDELSGLGEGDTWTVSRDWLHDRGQQSEKRMLLFSITGAALVAGGATVYYLGERDAKKPPAEAAGLAVSPAMGPTSAGVQVSGRF